MPEPRLHVYVTVIFAMFVTLSASGAVVARSARTEQLSVPAAMAWERFTRAYGTDWQMDWNEVTGTPRRISGSSLDAGERVTRENVKAVSLRLARRFQDLLLADPDSLVFANAEFLEPRKGARAAGTWYIFLRQEFRGVPVEGGVVRFLIRNQKLTMMGSDFFRGIDLPTEPRVDLERALNVVRTHMGAHAPRRPVSTQLIVWPDTRFGALRYRLVWQIVMPVVSVPAFMLQTRPPSAIPPQGTPDPAYELRPAQWRYLVDAIDGSILQRINLMVEQGLSGHVTATVRPLLPTDPLTLVNIADTTVTVTQGATTASAQTDSGGNYNVPGLTAGSATVTSGLAGPHVTMQNVEIASATHAATVTIPGTHDWNWSAYDLSWSGMEQNAYYHVKRIRDRFLSGGPFNVSPIPDPMPVSVGDGPSTAGGAYAGPDGLFFNRAYALCADFYYHEYTHRIVESVYTTAGACLQCAVQNGSMNEGWADYFAASFTNVPNFGAGCFAGRNIDTPDLRMPDNWVGTVHEDGVIFSGALWDTRTALGAVYVDGLALRAIKQAPMGGFTEYLQAMLEEDDDPSYNTSPLANNILADGTPNDNAICHAYYDLHGIYRPACIGHTTTPLAVITSPPALTYPLFTRAANVFNSAASSIAIAGTAGASSSGFQSFKIEYASHTAPAIWLSTGVSLTGGGTAPVNNGTLGTLSTAGLVSGMYVVRLTVTDTATATATATTNVVIDPALKAGWPQGQWMQFGGTPAVAEIDPAFPGLEVVARSNGGQLYVWHKDGTVAPGWPKDGGLGWSAPAVGDLDGDGILEVVVADIDGDVKAFHRGGSAVAGWPKSCGTQIYPGGAALADLDGNGTLEVVVASNTTGQVCAWDHTGAAVAGWPASTLAGSETSPAAADLDGDGTAEVVVGTVDGRVYVFKNDGTPLPGLPGWPELMQYRASASPAIGDIDGDGDLDIVAGSRFDKVYAWDRSGAGLAGWPQLSRTYIPASIVIADVDGSGAREVVAMTDLDVINVWSGNGALLIGWPPAGTSSGGDFAPASPAVADIDGDGQREVIAVGKGSAFSQFFLSKVWAFHRDGTMAAGWPKFLASQINSSPVVTDVDQDGIVDVVFGTSGGVYVWGLAGAYTNGPTDWLTFRHDNQRTGAATASAAVDQQQPSIDATVGGLAIGWGSQEILAQTVTAGVAGTLTEVRLPVACTPPADLIVSIEGVTAAGLPNGTVLSTRTFSGSTLPSFYPAPPTLRSFALTTGVPLIAGQRYAIVLNSSGVTASAGCGIFHGPLGDPYPGGKAYFDARPNAPGWVCICDFAGSRFDLPFQTVMTH